MKLENNIFGCILFILVVHSACIKQIDLYQDKENNENNQPGYIYPFDKEAGNVTAEIMIHTNGEIQMNDINSEIPFLKYNKSLLFMLTQDDCKHAAYSCTWAAINGKPLSNKYYYDAAHLRAGDLPPDVFYLGKTLGSTDGAGNEIRFSFSTTLAPEWDWMDAKTHVDPGFTKNYYRFFMKSGLTWDNVKEMMNYGTGITFHDVKTNDVSASSSILEHYDLAQTIILTKLSGRGCKTLAEPNGNKTYVTAAQAYTPIQTMTAQTQTMTLYPFQVTNDLHKILISRTFYDDLEKLKNEITGQMKLNKEERKAIYLAVHGTYYNFADFLLWLNNSYGKDGDDSVWFPSQEEYYEYNYYRIHGTTRIEQIDDNTFKLTVTLPSEQYFYYPSVTVNLKGLSIQNISSVNSTDAVTGLSYSNYENGVMLNIDCRKYLMEHATHYVELYEKDKSNKSNKADAHYFVNMLKESGKKDKLLNRIGMNQNVTIKPPAL